MSNSITPREQLETMIRSGAPIISVRTQEFGRVRDTVTEMAANWDRFVMVWTQTAGIKFLTLKDESGVEYVKQEGDTLIVGPEKLSMTSLGLPSDLEVTVDPSFAVLGAISINRPCVLIVQGFDDFIESPQAKQFLYDAFEALSGQKKTIILVGEPRLPAAIQKLVTVIDWALPTVEELQAMVEFAAAFVQRKIDAGESMQLDLTDDGARRIAEAMKGMARTEAAQAIKTLIYQMSGIVADNATIKTLSRHRAQIVQKAGGALEYIEPTVNLDSIGGNEFVKQYLQEIKYSFDPAAVAFGAEIPRGLLMIGPPGTGKTLGAKVAAEELGLPLVKLDMSKIFGESGGIVGQSERQLYNALAIIDAIAPCVLFVDEIEKGVSSGGELDGGTSQRVLGTLLTWMEEKGKGRVFFVATANRGRIDPALLRRIGARFLIDLPGPSARRDILRIKFAERNRFDLAALEIDLEPVVEMTKGYSGGELEVVVSTAMGKAYADVRQNRADDVQQSHLLAAVSEVSPVSLTMEREIQEMRAWADGRARPASAEACDWVPGDRGTRAEQRTAKRKARKDDGGTSDGDNVPFGKFLS